MPAGRDVVLGALEHDQHLCCLGQRPPLRIAAVTGGARSVPNGPVSRIEDEWNRVGDQPAAPPETSSPSGCAAIEGLLRGKVGFAEGGRLVHGGNLSGRRAMTGWG